MDIKKVLRGLDFSVPKEEIKVLKEEVDRLMKKLEEETRKKAEAEIFLGGSFAKNTLVKSDNYDVDIFVRFDWKYEKISDILESVVKKVGEELGLEVKRIHGSRDYFRISGKSNLVFEIIPVTKIKRVQEARNVTDLSYFHVNYVRKNLNEKTRKELALAKKFFKAGGFYGAESYIQGFSGYGLECLIIHYKNFERMLKKLIEIERDKQIVIDTKKFYKKKNEVFFSMNESKMQGPIILVDPTWKERNVLASLSRETFEKFQERTRKFLKNPSKKFFEEGGREMLGNTGGETVMMIIETTRQEGDIAGTKMKKFFNMLVKVTEKKFDVKKQTFWYAGHGVESEGALLLKPKKEIIKLGPPLEKKRDVERFRARNGKTFVKGGIVYAQEKIDFGAKEFLKMWSQSREGKIKMKDMGIRKIHISN